MQNFSGSRQWATSKASFLQIFYGIDYLISIKWMFCEIKIHFSIFLFFYNRIILNEIVLVRRNPAI
jgi:hypothetical protein